MVTHCVDTDLTVWQPATVTVSVLSCCRIHKALPIGACVVCAKVVSELMQNADDTSVISQTWWSVA